MRPPVSATDILPPAPDRRDEKGNAGAFPSTRPLRALLDELLSRIAPALAAQADAAETQPDQGQRRGLRRLRRRMPPPRSMPSASTVKLFDSIVDLLGS